MLKQKNNLLKVIIIIGLLLFPQLFRNNSYIVLLLCTSAISIIVVSGLDILFGYSGQISLGHAGFYCIGAYSSAILSKSLGLPVVLTVIFGAMLATIIAILIALPAARLIHHFLALITIAFGELIYLFVAHADKLTGGFSGINFIPKPAVGGFVFDTNLSYYYFVLFFTLILLLVKARIVSSRTGRALIAVRENTHSSDGIGINVKKYKVLAFALSAFYAGIAGALYGHLIGFISPESFQFSQSIVFLTMLLFGGMGNFWGPVIGAVTLTMVAESLQKLGSYQMLIYGIFLLVIIVFIPSGLTKGKNPVKLITAFFKKKGEMKTDA